MRVTHRLVELCNFFYSTSALTAVYGDVCVNNMPHNY